MDEIGQFAATILHVGTITKRNSPSRDLHAIKFPLRVGNDLRRKYCT